MFDQPAYMEPIFPGKDKALAELAMKVYADAAELMIESNDNKYG